MIVFYLCSNCALFVLYVCPWRGTSPTQEQAAKPSARQWLSRGELIQASPRPRPARAKLGVDFCLQQQLKASQAEP